MMTVHATAIAIDGRAILLLGAPGIGKSDLALRLIDRGAALIADDAVVLTAANGRAAAAAPSGPAPRLLVAGIGPVTPPRIAGPTLLSLAITLVHRPPAALADIGHHRLGDGTVLPHLMLDPRPASAPLLAALALDRWGL